MLKRTGALPCAASYELETQQPQHETTLLGVGSPLVFGGPTTSIVTTKQPTGTYLICTWVEARTGRRSTVPPSRQSPSARRRRRRRRRRRWRPSPASP